MARFTIIRKFIEKIFLEYIRFCAKLQLLKIRPKIIGLTGSAGKTSLRDAIFSILKTKYIVKKTKKANSETGIPLDILDLHISHYSYIEWLKISFLVIWKLFTNWKKYEIYIVEMGIDSPYEPKNMSYLLKIIKPETGIFINATATHTETFDPLAKEKNPQKRLREIMKLIATEKGKLITNLNCSNYAVLNIEDSNVANFINKTKANIITVGHYKNNAQLSFKNIQITLDGFKCTYIYNNVEKILHYPFSPLGTNYAITFGLAIAVGLIYNIDISESINVLVTSKLPPGRMSLIPGIKKTIIIDSSYNASKAPTLNAIQMLNNIGQNKKKTLILGDLRELGKESKFEHEAVAKKAISVCDQIYLTGPLMKKFFLPFAIKKGFPSHKLHWFSTKHFIIKHLKKKLQKGEIILIKGSQNTLFLETIVEALMLNPHQAKQLLCRRGVYWNEQRQKHP